MNTKNLLDLYEEVKDDLKFHGISSVRVKIMISLNEGTKKTKHLRKELGVQSSTILHSINELEKQNLVFRKGDNYCLSQTGEIIIPKLTDMIRTLIVTKKYGKLWQDHEIDSIPDNLIMDIGNLSNSELIVAENTDILKPHRTYLQLLLNSQKIRAVSPICHPDYITTLKKVINNDDVDIELILTENIIEKLSNIDSKNLELMDELISKNKLKLWKLENDTKISFTVTDSYLSLGLFSTKGAYDPTKDLISNHEDAIAWGNQLFEHYLKQAERIKP